MVKKSYNKGKLGYCIELLSSENESGYKKNFKLVVLRIYTQKRSG